MTMQIMQKSNKEIIPYAKTLQPLRTLGEAFKPASVIDVLLPPGIIK